MRHVPSVSCMHTPLIVQSINPPEKGAEDAQSLRAAAIAGREWQLIAGTRPHLAKASGLPAIHDDSLSYMAPSWGRSLRTSYVPGGTAWHTQQQPQTPLWVVRLPAPSRVLERELAPAMSGASGIAATQPVSKPSQCGPAYTTATALVALGTKVFQTHFPDLSRKPPNNPVRGAAQAAHTQFCCEI